VGTTIHDESICIRHWDWSETSQTVSLFTREHGVIRGLAKGSKREKSPFSGGVELLTRGEVVAIIRSSGAMATVTEWDLLDAYPGVRRSLRAFYVGSYLIDLVHHAVTDADPHPGLFGCLVEVLEILSERPEEALLCGQWGVLAETGYAPDLGATPEKSGAEGVCFLPREGVFRPADGNGGQHVGWRVRSETVGLLGCLARGERLPSATDSVTVERAGRLLGSYIRYVLGRELPSALSVFGADGLVA
jgi:hypothetical protein